MKFHCHFESHPKSFKTEMYLKYSGILITKYEDTQETPKSRKTALRRHQKKER